MPQTPPGRSHLGAHTVTASSPNGPNPRCGPSPCHHLPMATAMGWMDLLSPTCKMGTLRTFVIFGDILYIYIHKRHTFFYRRAQYLLILLININIITKVSAFLKKIKHPPTQTPAAVLIPPAWPTAPTPALPAAAPAQRQGEGQGPGLGHLTTQGGHLYYRKKKSKPHVFSCTLRKPSLGVFLAY